MTTGERLRQLAGQGGTAAALLLLIGSGATAGAALVDYSGLPSGTAMEHLLAEAEQDAAPGGGQVKLRGAWVIPKQFAQAPSRRRDEDVLMLLAAL